MKSTHRPQHQDQHSQRHTQGRKRINGVSSSAHGMGDARPVLPVLPVRPVEVPSAPAHPEWIELPLVRRNRRGVLRQVQRPDRMTAEIVAARRAFVAPLFTYMTEHAMSAIALVRRAAVSADPDRYTERVFRRSKLTRIRSGVAPAPRWLIAGVCREIGLPIETVMGAEWARRHLPAMSQQAS